MEHSFTVWLLERRSRGAEGKRGEGFPYKNVGAAGRKFLESYHYGCGSNIFLPLIAVKAKRTLTEVFTTFIGDKGS